MSVHVCGIANNTAKKPLSRRSCGRPQMLTYADIAYLLARVRQKKKWATNVLFADTFVVYTRRGKTVTIA